MCDNIDWKKNVHKIGIVEEEEGILYLKWSASGVEFETTSQRIEAVVYGEYFRKEEKPYLGVFIETAGEMLEQKIEIEAGENKYLLYDNCGKEKIKVRIVKLTEEQYGRVGIVSLVTDEPVYPLEDLEQKILFIGDSITAAYGVEGINGISVFRTKEENVCLGYAYLTAKKLNVEPIIVAYSGNGIISRWIPQDEEEPNTEQLLINIFPYDMEPEPSLLVCNLGTNDASYTRSDAIKEQKFVEQYENFVGKLKKRFPNIPILLIYGVIEKGLSEKVKEVAKHCNTFYLELPLQCEEDELGTDEHPGKNTHKKMCNLLSEEIKKIMAW